MTQTVRVRIAVAVGPDGSWSACGWLRESTGQPADKDAMDIAVDATVDGGARYWVVATLPLPTAATAVEADVVLVAQPVSSEPGLT